jgi:hypothetical protein
MDPSVLARVMHYFVRFKSVRCSQVQFRLHLSQNGFPNWTAGVISVCEGRIELMETMAIGSLALYQIEAGASES